MAGSVRGSVKGSIVAQSQQAQSVVDYDVEMKNNI